MKRFLLQPNFLLPRTYAIPSRAIFLRRIRTRNVFFVVSTLHLRNAIIVT